MATLHELNERHAALLVEAKKVRSKAVAWDQLEADDRTRLEGILKDADGVKDQIEALVKDGETKRRLDDHAAWATTSAGKLPGMSSGGGAGPGELKEVQYRDHTGDVKAYTPTGVDGFEAKDEVAYTDTMRRYLKGGPGALTPEDHRLINAKALSVGSDPGGGFLVADEVMYQGLLDIIEDEVFMRREATVLPPLTAATSLALTGVATDWSDADWTVELGVGNEEALEPFGRANLTPHPLGRLVRVSNHLLRLSSINVEAWVNAKLGARFARAEERAYMVGTGAAQPVGVFTSALPTAVTAANQTTFVTDDLYNMEFALHSQYLPGCSWIVNRTVLRQMYATDLVDGLGRPLLLDTVGSAGGNKTLLGYPVHSTEFAPNTVTAGLATMAFGNWKRAYMIVDTLNYTVQRLTELYALTNQVGFIGRKETDGMVVDGNACAVLRMHA